jgi:hypothetical protein
MSNFEDKLRSLPFREPPSDLRRQVLAAAEAALPRWTWRDWFWPSPIAWAGLAAIWMTLFFFDSAPTPAAPAPEPSWSARESFPSSLYASRVSDAALLEMRF